MALESKTDAEMKLSIQIVNFRSRRCLKGCLFSIGENLPSGIKAEVLIINNDDERLENFKDGQKGKLDIQILDLGKNVGFGRAHNAGFRLSRGEYILFLNPDTKISPGALISLLDVLEKNKSIGIAGPLLVDSAGEIQPDCFGARKSPLSAIGEKIFKRKKPEIGNGAETFEADWISGGAMLARRNVFAEAGGFDEKYFMYFEDVDLCLRVKKIGHKIAVASSAHIFHESGKSFASKREKKKRYYTSQDYYFRKHFGRTGAILVKLLRLPYYVKNVYFNR